MHGYRIVNQNVHLYFCTIDDFKLRTEKAIYEYANRHLRCWFPKLPKYEAFNYRVNKLNEYFRYLAVFINKEKIAQHADFQKEKIEYAGDSMPIVMAKGVRGATAKVATEIANLGYCATKKMYYHGLKLHHLNVVASSNHLPHPALSTISSASAHDCNMFKNELLHKARNSKCYLDSAYYDLGNKEFIEQTGIQNASKARATKGVLSHIYGKIAVLCFWLFLTFNSHIKLTLVRLPYLKINRMKFPFTQSVVF